MLQILVLFLVSNSNLAYFCMGVHVFTFKHNTVITAFNVIRATLHCSYAWIHKLLDSSKNITCMFGSIKLICCLVCADIQGCAEFCRRSDQHAAQPVQEEKH